MELEQLSFLTETRVVVRWYRHRQSSDAMGPSDTAYEASVLTHPEICGWGRTEAVALETLADRLRASALDLTPAGLGADAQALVAARRLDREDLVSWLRHRTSPTELGEPV